MFASTHSCVRCSLSACHLARFFLSHRHGGLWQVAYTRAPTAAFLRFPLIDKSRGVLQGPDRPGAAGNGGSRVPRPHSSAARIVLSPSIFTLSFYSSRECAGARDLRVTTHVRAGARGGPPPRLRGELSSKSLIRGSPKRPRDQPEREREILWTRRANESPESPVPGMISLFVS